VKTYSKAQQTHSSEYSYKYSKKRISWKGYEHI